MEVRSGPGHQRARVANTSVHNVAAANCTTPQPFLTSISNTSSLLQLALPIAGEREDHPQEQLEEAQGAWRRRDFIINSQKVT